MRIKLFDLALETTRRCNLQCGHCMRGRMQNIDMSTSIVDRVFDNSEIVSIYNLLFSGGEPTLNPDIIIYTINKIINDNIDVTKISMITNGQLFNRELIESFNRYNQYQNRRLRDGIIDAFGDNEELAKSIIDGNMDGHVIITFSTDKYHQPIPQEVRDQYFKYARGLIIKEHSVQDSNIKKTGFATIGNEYHYQLRPLKVYTCKDEASFFNLIYVTANGNITNVGDGQYTDMDKTNFGNIMEMSLEELASNNGLSFKDYINGKTEKPKEYVLK